MKLPLVAIFIAAALVGLGQHREIDLLRSAIETEQQNLTRANHRTDDPLQSDRHCPTDAQIATMRAERSELLRLRASIAELRAAARGEAEIRAEIEKLNQRIAGEKQSAKAIEDTFHLNQSAKAVQATLQGIAVLMQMAGNDPEEVRVEANPPLPEPRPRWEFLAASHPAFDEEFEFIPAQPAPARAILLRERVPRALPNGLWTRLYLLVNYRIETRTQTTGNFTGWESGHE